jgi:PAS domain S-box-containing protein
MKPNTASCFLLVGLALALQHAEAEPSRRAARRRTLGRVLAAISASIGAWTVLEYLFGVRLGLDEWISPAPDGGAGGAAMRMSIATAVGFSLIGSALVVLDHPRSVRLHVAEVLSLTTVVAGLLALVGFLYDAETPYGFSAYSTMALLTALLFFLLGLGTLLVRPRRALVRVLTSDHGGGPIARRMAPVAVTAPLVIGVLCQTGSRAGYYEMSFAIAVFTVASMLIFAALTWRAALALDRVDEQRGEPAGDARAHAENLSVTLHSIADAVIATDAAGRITIMNAVAEGLTGWSEAEATGRPVDDVFRVVDEATGRETDSFAMRVLGEESFATMSGAALVEARDGTRRPIAARGSPIRGLDGRALSGAVIVFRDQTDERQWMQALSDSERRTRALVNASAQVFWSADPEGLAFDESPSWYAFTGQSLEQRQGRGWLDVVHENDRGDVEELWRKSVASCEGLDVECRVRHVSGEWRWMAVRAVPLTRDDGSVSGWVGMNADITERKRAEAATEASLAEKEVLLTEIHHRVKNNMQVISSILGLQAGLVNDERARLAFDECQGRVQSMSLVHERLYQSANLASIDFAEHLRDVCELIAVAFDQPARRVELVVEAESLAMGLDVAVPVGLIANELLTNALKHAFPGRRDGVVRVSLRHEGGGKVALTVADDGVGIPPDLDWQKARTLGLRMVRSLLRQIDGELEIERDRGTRVTARFPAAAASAAPESAPAGA